jgi:hypothetical protein
MLRARACLHSGSGAKHAGFSKTGMKIALPDCTVTEFARSTRRLPG